MFPTGGGFALGPLRTGARGGAKTDIEQLVNTNRWFIVRYKMLLMILMQLLCHCTRGDLHGQASEAERSGAEPRQRESSGQSEWNQP